MPKRAIITISLVREGEDTSNEQIEKDIKETLKCDWLSEVEKVTIEQSQLKEGMQLFYSHTSRVWNSAVALTLTGVAISIATMLSSSFPFRDVNLLDSIPIGVPIGIIMYTAVVYGFWRVVELGCQLQFLETQIKMNGKTLLEYISGDVPRIKFHKRLSLEKAKELEGKNITLKRFAKQHWLGLVVWTALFMLVFISRFVST
jgi:hypothetical protein